MESPHATTHCPPRRIPGGLRAALGASTLLLTLTAVGSAAHAQASTHELVPGESRSVSFGNLLEILEILPGTETTLGVSASSVGPFVDSLDLTGDGRLTCAVADNDLVFTGGPGAPVSDTCVARVCSLPLGGLLRICRTAEFALSLVTCRTGDDALDPGCSADAPACEIDADSGERTCVGCTEDAHCGAAAPFLVAPGVLTPVTDGLLRSLLGLGLLAPLQDVAVRANVNDPFSDEALIGSDLTCAVVDGQVVVEPGADADASGTCYIRACVPLLGDLLGELTCVEAPLDVLVDLCALGGACTNLARCDTAANQCVVCEDTAEPGAIDAGCRSDAPACAMTNDGATCMECQADADCAPGLLSQLLAPMGETTLPLEDLLEFLRLGSNVMPSSLAVSNTIDGPFDDTAVLGTDVLVADCAVTTDGDIALSAVATEGHATCYVEVCVDVLGGTVETCVVAPVDIAVDACVLSGTCHVSTVCRADGTCGDCVDTEPAGAIDRGCDRDTPACNDDSACVECLADPDCNLRTPLVDLDLGQEAVLGRDTLLTALNLDPTTVDVPVIQVGPTALGEFDDTALLGLDGQVGSCTVNPDGGVTVLASSTVYGDAVCHVQVCTSILTLETCLVLPIEVNVDPCASRGDCQPPVCGAGSRCQVCRDDMVGGQDSGCGPETPACREDASGVVDSVCTECTEDADCLGEGVCDTATNTCVACRDDAMWTDIDSGCDAVLPVCDVGGDTPTCVPCADLGDGELDEGCGTATPACLVATEVDAADRCVECTADADCQDGDVCDAASNTCVECRDDAAGGAMDAGCEPETPICTVDAMGEVDPMCRTCIDDTVGAIDTGCGTELPACDEDEDDGLCRECTVDADCAPGDTCAVDTFTCVTPTPNLPPVATDVVTTTDEDVALLILLSAFITDPEGDAFIVTRIDLAPSFGAATVEPGNAVLFVPPPDASGSAAFTYEVCDARGACSLGRVRIEVLPVNDAPRAFDDTVAIEVDGAGVADVLANDIDPDGDVLTVVSVLSDTAEVSAVVDGDGFVAVEASGGFSGIANVTYEACDPEGACESAVLMVVVGGDPIAFPVANPDTASVAPGASVDIDVLENDSAPDGLTLVVAAWTQGGNGRVAANVDGGLRYTAGQTAVGVDVFRYAACTADGRCAATTVTVTVGAGGDNRAPQAIQDFVTTTVDTPVTFDPTANDLDPDGDPLSVESFTAPTSGTLTLGAEGSLVYTPDEGFIGTDSAMITVVDPGGLTATAPVVFTVTENANQAPVAMNDAIVVMPETDTVVDVLANDSDPDGDPLVIIEIEQPARGRVTLAPTTTFGFNGPVTRDELLVRMQDSADGTPYTDTFRYRISDGRGGRGTASVTVDVTRNPNGPIARDDLASTDEDVATTIDVRANDALSEGRAWAGLTIATPPAHGEALVQTDGVISYAPMADFHGVDTFTYTTCDDTGACATATVQVMVSPVEDAPVARDDVATVLTGSVTVLDLLGNDSDPDGDVLVISAILEAPTAGALTVAADGRSATFAAPADRVGTFTARYEACDPGGLCDSATVTLNVQADPAGAPMAMDDEVVTARNRAVTFWPMANDQVATGMTAFIDGWSDLGVGELWQNGDAVRYVPPTDWLGTTSFSYTLCDTIGRCDEGTVTVHVLEVEPDNRAPVANDDTFAVDPGAAVDLDVLANDSDPDGDTLSVRITVQGLRGTAAVTAAGTVLYTPADAGAYEDQFVYEACDPAGLCDDAVVRISAAFGIESPALMAKGGPNCAGGSDHGLPWALSLLVVALLAVRRRALR